MTFYVTCPDTKEDIPFETITEIRSFIVANMKNRPECNKKIRIRKGKKTYGWIWREGHTILYKSVGGRNDKTKFVNMDGSLRRN